MKKVFSVLMVCAFAISATAQWLIYDYKVSIKRIDAQYSKLSYKIDEFDAKIPKNAGCPNYVTGYFDSFTTANDTLSGYIIMPACKTCSGMWKQFGSATFYPALNDPLEVGKDWINVTSEDDFNATVIDWLDWQDAFNVAKFTDGKSSPTVYETAYAYIQRKADKLYANPLKASFGSKSKTIDGKLTWKTPVNVDAARFGKGAGSRLNSNKVGSVYCTCKEWLDSSSAYGDIIEMWYALPTSAKAVKEAWMVLTYDITTWIGTDSNDVIVPPAYQDKTIIYPPVKGLVVDEICTPKGLAYGLLGYQSKSGSISHAGFGKVTTTGTPGSTSVGFCGSVTVDPTSCTAVNTISGTIAGLFEASSFCSYTPEWDICYYFAKDSFFAKVEEDGSITGGNKGLKSVAPVSGDWTLKLNQSESKKYGATFESAEARVLHDKLKCYPLSSWKTELRENFIYNAKLPVSGLNSPLDDYNY